jgi:hypothetical protein
MLAYFGSPGIIELLIIGLILLMMVGVPIAVLVAVVVLSTRSRHDDRQ